MSRSVLLFALSIVLSLSFVLYSPTISPVIEATSPNLTVKTYTGLPYMNINQSDRFHVAFSTSYISNKNVTIYISPNNQTSTNNKPYFFIDNNSIDESCHNCDNCWLNSKTINYLDGNESLSVVNITYTLNNPSIGTVVNIYFDATPINPQAILYTNWTGRIDTDTYSTQNPFTIRPPYLTINDLYAQSRTVYLGDNLTLAGFMINNSDSPDYTGDAYNITATADNTTTSLEIISNKTIDVTDILHPAENQFIPPSNWTINAKSLGQSNISITAKDQTGAYNDTINVTINVVNLTVTPGILEENPIQGEPITIIANITDNASKLFPPDIDLTYANLTYLALNETSGNLELYESQACLTESFELNETLSGTDYTVLTCKVYIPERSGLYNLTISVTDQYFSYNGTETILKSKTTTNTSNFTVSFGKLNLTKTFAMMLAVNETFDNPQGFWQYGEDKNPLWQIDSGIMMYLNSPNSSSNVLNLIDALPESTDNYIEVNIYIPPNYNPQINTPVGIVFRNTLDKYYTFGFNGVIEGDNYSFTIIKYETKGTVLKSQIITSGNYYNPNFIGNISKYSIYIIGNEFIGFINDLEVVRGVDEDPIEYGKVGIYSSYINFFDNFKVYNILDPKDALLLNQTFKIQSFAEVEDGDLWGPTNYTISKSNSKISNQSAMGFQNASNLTLGSWQIINWGEFDTDILGYTNFTIEITSSKGTTATQHINTTIVPLIAYIGESVINYSHPNINYINVTGFGPSLNGPNGMFSVSIKPEYSETEYTVTNFTFDSTLSDITNNNYVYSNNYTSTYLSGNYDLDISMRNQYNKNISNTTESFFVNYGYLSIIILANPGAITWGDSAMQSVDVYAYGGDVRNITLNMTSLTPNYLDLYLGEISNRTEMAILNNQFKTYTWNISAAYSAGYANLSVSGNATYGGNDTTNKYNINITSGVDTEAPKILNVSLKYDIVNLKENMTIYAKITDDYGVHTAVTQIFYPNLSGYSENYTMTFDSTIDLYYFTFTNTTILTNDTESYNIQIYANDSKSLLNASDNSTTFNTTNYYHIDPNALNYNLFNLGESMIATIPVHTINNNTITDFNLTLMLKKSGAENATVLLPNNKTDSYTYYINASDPTGLYTLDMNVSKDGNTANFSGNFTVSNVYTPNFIQPTSNYQTQQPQANLYDFASPLIEVFNARGELVQSWGVNVWITCAQPSNISLFINGIWQHYVDSGTTACQMPSFEGPFDILAFVHDTYNNSGTSSLQMNVQAYGSPPPSTGGSISPGSSFPPYTPDFIPYSNISNYSSYNENLNIFSFELGMRDINMFQGENREITINLNNVGRDDLNLSASYESRCCSIDLNETYFVKSGNNLAISLVVSSMLSEEPGTYIMKIKISNGDKLQEQNLNIRLDKNQLISDFEYIKNDFKRIKNILIDLNRFGIDVGPYMELFGYSETLMLATQQSIMSNDLQSFDAQIVQLSALLNSLNMNLTEKENIIWVIKNRYNLAGLLISLILFVFALKYYLFPLILLSIEYKQLKSKEFNLAAEEKSTEKEYFTRVIDKSTFNNILTKKHEQLTNIRTRMVHIRKSIKLLMHGHNVPIEYLNETHNTGKKSKNKSKSIFGAKPIKLKSFMGFTNPLSYLSLRKEETSPTSNQKTRTPINLAEKTPMYPKGQNFSSSQTSTPVMSKTGKKLSKIGKNKNLGDEMREIYGGNLKKEESKESFNDIKKKINNIFDD
ncbi:MAG: hypothetical protein K0B07_02115 [DPANN group archaeon]|nr:hypothetical protein [DPANN group archaeon]